MVQRSEAFLYSQDVPEPSKKGFSFREALLRMLPEGTPSTGEIAILDPKSLQPILEWAYGIDDWTKIDQTSEWKYHNPNPDSKKQWPKEVQQTYANLRRILEWTHDPETRGHLDPAPGVPVYDKDGKTVKYNRVNFQNKRDVDHAVADLAKYYYNAGEPDKISTLVALNTKEEALGVLTIRWKDVLYGPKKHKFSYIERLVVDPKLRGLGIGTELIGDALKTSLKRGYSEIRTWIMKDVPGWGSVMELFARFGFRQLSGPDSDWGKYVARRLGMPPTKRKANQYILDDAEAWLNETRGTRPKPVGAESV